MNDDLKAYVDGELPPDAAERLRTALDADPALAREADALRALGVALRRLPEPDPVGRAATLAALQRRPKPLWRVWAPALAGCAAVLAAVVALPERELGPLVRPAGIEGLRKGAPSVETAIPAVRREAFERFVRQRGGQVRRDGDGLRAFYPSTAHEAVKRRFLLPENLAWPTDGLRVRLER